jgi:hypothetical protein
MVGIGTKREEMKTARFIARTLRLLPLLAALLLWRPAYGQSTAEDVNSVPAHAERMAKLFGSYLTAIADRSTPDATKDHYRRLAEELFGAGATVEISSIRHPGLVTMTLHEYIHDHFEALVRRHHYTDIQLEWQIDAVAPRPSGSEVECVVNQAFLARSDVRPNIYYGDSTLKTVTIVLQKTTVPVNGAKQVEFQGLQVQSIKVLQTWPLNTRRPKKST